MVRYLCNKCKIEDSQVELNKLNEDLELCQKCLDSYKVEYGNLIKKHDKEMSKLNSKFNIE